MSPTSLDGARVLAYAPRLWPTWGAGTQRTTAFLLGLVRAGASVRARVVVPAQRPDRPASLVDIEIDQIVDPIARVPWQIKHAAMCLGLSDAASPGFRRGRRTREPTADIVFASGPPWSAVREAALTASHIGAPLVVDMRDEWAANPFQTKLGPLFHALDRRREHNTLVHAAAISAPYSDVLDSLPAGGSWTRCVIPHGCEVDLVTSIVTAARMLRPGGPLRLLFAGARYGMINEGDFLRALMRSPVPVDLELRLVGSDRPVRDPTPERVLVTARPGVSHPALMEEYDACDALLALSPARRGRGWVPSKLPEYIATGRPILGFGAADSKLQQELTDVPGSVFVDEARPAELEQGLRTIHEMACSGTDYRAGRALRGWNQVGDEGSAFLARALARST